MIKYPNYYNYPRPLSNVYQNNDRQFLVPFLLGGLAGGAAIGLTRPRPIYNVAPYNNFNPYVPYYYNSYGGYVPYYR